MRAKQASGTLKRGFTRIAYLRNMIKWGHIDIYAGEQVSILGLTQAEDKYIIEFHRDIFLDEQHKFNTGCNGQGRINRCLYIPTQYIEDYSTFPDIELLWLL